MPEDLISLIPKSEVSRRAFIATTLASGFALATHPVAAQTLITTDTAGLEAGEVKIPVADGEIPAYRAVPARAGKFPVVLVVQEIFGTAEVGGERPEVSGKQRRRLTRTVLKPSLRPV